MEYKTVYLNKSKPRKTLSNINFTEDIIHPAHSLETHGFSPYVERKAFDELVYGLRMVAKTGNEEHAADALNLLNISTELPGDKND